jgi:hypothetical protein
LAFSLGTPKVDDCKPFADMMEQAIMNLISTYFTIASQKDLYCATLVSHIKSYTIDVTKAILGLVDALKVNKVSLKLRHFLTKKGENRQSKEIN